PGEIEAALRGDRSQRGQPGVREAAVVAGKGPGGDKRLVGFVVLHPTDPTDPTDRSDFREHLRQSLPDYMVPAAWVVLPELPLNASGKVDRAALRRLVPAEAGGAGGSPTAPRAPEEELLAGIFAEILGRERVGIDEDFFTSGGHLLLAMRMVSRISRVFGVDLSVSAVFQEPTVARLAARLAGTPAAAAPILPVPRPVPRAAGEPLPLSFAPRRLWFLDRLEPGTAVYNIAGAVRLRGRLDVPLVAAALAGIARRHEVLRTVFPARHGEPVQVVQEPGFERLPVVDLSGLPEPARSAEADRRGRAEAARPFDLARGPLVRTSLLRLEDEEHLLVVTFHHIVSDGWSLGLYLEELRALYAEPSPPRPPSSAPPHPLPGRGGRDD